MFGVKKRKKKIRAESRVSLFYSIPFHLSNPFKTLKPLSILQSTENPSFCFSSLNPHVLRRRRDRRHGVERGARSLHVSMPVRRSLPDREGGVKIGGRDRSVPQLLALHHRHLQSGGFHGRQVEESEFVKAAADSIRSLNQKKKMKQI